jgi:phosphate:Na+ symporter
LFTALVQSSSVTTGLAIIFAQQGLLSLENAVPIIMGANIGTTATVLVTIFNMDLAAKKTALSHMLFNVGGVVLFLPLFLLYGDRLNDIDTAPAIALANIHLVFNLVTSLVFIVFLGPFTRLVDTLLGEGKMDFQRLDIPSIDAHSDFDELRQNLEKSLVELLLFLQENYNLVTLSIETNYRSVFDASARRIEYVDFLEQEYRGQFSRAVQHVTDEGESKQLLALITRYDYLFQIHDSIDDLFQAKRTMNKQFVELKSDVLLMVRELSSYTLALFDDINKALAAGQPAQVGDRVRDLRACLEQSNHQLLPLLAHPDRRDAGALSNFITYSRRLMDKLVNFARLSAAQQRETAETLSSGDAGQAGRIAGE